MVGWGRVDRWAWRTSLARSGRAGSRLGWRRWHHAGSGLLALGLRLLADMLSIEALLARHHRPQDAGVLVGHGNAGFLPAHAQHELLQPAAGRVISLGRTRLAALITADFAPWISSVRK